MHTPQLPAFQYGIYLLYHIYYLSTYFYTHMCTHIVISSPFILNKNSSYRKYMLVLSAETFRFQYHIDSLFGKWRRYLDIIKHPKCGSSFKHEYFISMNLEIFHIGNSTFANLYWSKGRTLFHGNWYTNFILRDPHILMVQNAVISLSVLNCLLEYYPTMHV